jgi:hypothetical protein
VSIFDKLFRQKLQAPAQPSFDEAREIVGAYGGILESGPAPGTVADATELPYPKERIKAALLLLLKMTTDSTMRSHLSSGYVCLADWQPGVGPQRIGVDVGKIDLTQDTATIARQLLADDVGSSEWLRKVKAEQEALVHDLRRLGYL